MAKWVEVWGGKVGYVIENKVIGSEGSEDMRIRRSEGNDGRRN